MRKRINFISEKGQISLLIILVGVIALSVGLAFVSRSITDSRAAVAQQNSQQALAAAEAGVQLAINQNKSISSQTFQSGNIQNVNKYSVGGSSCSSSCPINPEFLISGGNSVVADQGADIWLVDHTNNAPDFTKTPYSGNLTVYWAPLNDLSGNPTNYSCSSGAIVPALEIITYMGNTKDAKNKITSALSHRYVFDPCSRISGNPATSTGITDASQSYFNDSYITQYQNLKFNYSVTISTTDSSNPTYKTYLIEFIPLFNSSIMGVESHSTSTLPSQGDLYISTGTSGDTQRTISYFHGFPQLPMVYSLYSR